MACSKFYLEFVNNDEGNLIEIDEPTSWSEITLNLETPDRKMFGRNFSFSKGEVPLVFEESYDTLDKGHQFDKLIEYYKLYGPGACVRFYYDDCGTTLLLGELNYKGVKTDGCQSFEVNIIQSQNSNLVLEQIETNANLKSDTTLNGEVCDPMPTETFCLLSKEINHLSQQTVFEEFNDIANTIEWDVDENGKKEGANHIFDLNSINDPDINNNLYFYNGNQSIGASNYSFRFDEDFSVVNVELKMCFAVAFADFIFFSDTWSDESLSIILEHRQQDGTVVDQDVVYFDNSSFTVIPSFLQFPEQTPQDDGIYDSQFVKRQFSFSRSYTNIPKDNHLIAYFHFEANPSNDAGSELLRSWLRVYKEDSCFTVDGLSTVEPTEHLLPRLIDVIKKQIAYITDGKVNVVMPEFDIGGEYYEYFLANGYEVRKAGELEDRQFAYDFERSIESINAIFAAGYQVYGDTIFIGTPRQFYKDIDCGLLDYPVIEYSEQFDSDLLKNLFKFKYNKTPKDNNNTIDEFNTKSEYSLPVQKIKGKCDVKSDFIASGYLIEQERRKQFSESPTESSDLDDEMFIVNAVYSTELGKYINRTTENITNIDNLISPNTSYNIAISPLQNFSRWWLYVGSSTHYLSTDNDVVTTFFESNEFMQSQVVDSSTLPTTQIQKDTYDKSIFLDPIFEPKKVTVKMVNMPITDLINLKNEIFLKRGYYRVKDYKGRECSIFITDFEYNPCKEEITITGTKKSNNYGDVNTSPEVEYTISSSRLISECKLVSENII